MAETKHSTFRLPESTKKKLIELAQLDGISQAQVVGNLIIVEHRLRLHEIEAMKRGQQATEI